jgi:hypothetical protein
VPQAPAVTLALSNTAKQIFWWKRLFYVLKFELPHSIQILCDNNQTINLLTKEDLIYKTKLRNMDIQRHWLRQEIIKKL